MANDYDYIENTGVIIPDTADILTDVQTEFQNVFGADLNLDPSTPQALLIAAEVLGRNAVVRNNAALANQLNPNIAGGTALDAIWALTGGQRQPATKSIVTTTLTGVPGTIIPAGSQAQTTANITFESVMDVVLDGSGNGTVDFTAQDTGPIAALAGTLTKIVNNVLGWESVTNAADATLGQLTQSDQAVRALRLNTLALQGVALPVAITSALYNTAGVRSLTFQENIAATTQTINTISMVAHSIYVCVDGGQDLDVATALLENKSLGAAWNGSTTINVTEPASGQVYVVQFDRPTAVPIFMQVTVRSNINIADPVTEVKTAIIQYAAGLQEGEPGFTVGRDVSTFELAGAINRYDTNLYVQNLLIKKTGGSFATTEIAIAVNQIATIDPANISVTIL